MTNKEKAQNNNIDMIYKSLENLSYLANKKDYVVTDHEEKYLVILLILLTI